MDCPKCGHPAPFGTLECESCGVIFAKVSHSRTFVPPPLVAYEEERVSDGRVGPRELKLLAFGLGAAILAYVFPLTRYLLSVVVTLFHELGHAVAGWLFGYPSIPAFDLMYGGGLTHYGEFKLSIAVGIACGFGYLGWLFRQNRKSVALVVAAFAAWLLIVISPWRRELVMAGAGHLAEFILAAILFYKALAGVGWRNPTFERPLGAFVAFFVQIHSTLFAWRLRHDAEFLAWYRRGKGDALMNDLESIALDIQIRYGFAPQVEGVAKWLLVFSVLPTVVALVWYFERARWHRVLRALRTADA